MSDEEPVSDADAVELIRVVATACGPLATGSLGLRDLKDFAAATRLLATTAGRFRSELRAVAFDTAGSAFMMLADVTGDHRFLSEAAHAGRRSVEEAAADDPRRPGYLADLSVRLSKLSELKDDHAGLKEALKFSREAVATTESANPSLPLRLAFLAGLLSDLYDRDPDVRLLNEAVAAQRKSEALTPEAAPQKPERLLHLSYLLSAQHAANGRGALQTEACFLATKALGLVPDDGPEWPRVALTVSNFLAREAESFSAPDLLDEAVRLSRLAVARTPEGDPAAAAQRHTLARRLGAVFDRDREPEVLQQTIELARSAVAMTADDSPERAKHEATLADRLADQFELTGDVGALDEALPLSVHAAAAGATPRGRMSFAETAARVAGLRGRHGVARQVLTPALDTGLQLVAYANRDAFLMRDLAGAAAGIAAELAYHAAADGDAEAAIEVLERRRPWLRVMEEIRGPLAASPQRLTHVLWIAPAKYGTTVASSTHGMAPTVHLSSVTTGQMADRLQHLRSAEAQYHRVLEEGDVASFHAAVREYADAIEDLSLLAGRVLEGIEIDEHVVIIPVGAACLLPWAAARTGDAVAIDGSAVSVAPTLGLVGGAADPRGVVVAALWGEGLDLEGDRRTLSEVLGVTPLPEPTGEDVLELLRGSAVGLLHLSCHGRYEQENPLASALELAGGSRITVLDILDLAAHAQVVNLSACETGIPDGSRLDQFIGFPAAFLAAGASHVYATLWSVDDGAATLYNRALYSSLAGGAHPASAHRTALHVLRQRANLDAPPGASTGGNRRRGPRASIDVHPMAFSRLSDLVAPDHPFWWAAFTHYGASADIHRHRRPTRGRAL